MDGVHFSGFSLMFQLLNIALAIGIVIGIIYLVYFLLVKLPRNLNERNEILRNIEKTLNEINKKTDNKL